MEIATKDRWKAIPMTKPKILGLEILLSEIQFKRLKLGLVPYQMEDKWFIYYENNHVFFHRSWTRFEIFRAKINSLDNGCYSINEFYVEQNEEIYNELHDQNNISNFKSQIEYLSNRKINNHVKNAIFGVVVGDALGVPVEFKSREYLAQNPLTDMIGYGTYNQPAGTWSDDSSLTLCLADVLCNNFDLQTIGDSFVKWYFDKLWTPHGDVFDIGISTREAILRLKNGEKPEIAGNWEENSNGNGSLMRILPLMFEIQNLRKSKDRYNLIKKVSSITHGHVRSCLACFYYLELASFIASDGIGYPLKDAYSFANFSFKKLVEEMEINPEETKLFKRITDGKITSLTEFEIQSTGYVLHTLEASIWCLLTTKSYQEAVLKAINLGEDTDTTGAVVGGLAGLFYGVDSIPKKWIETIARKNDIEDLTNKLSDKYKIARC